MMKITRRGLFKIIVAAPFVAAVRPSIDAPVSMLGFSAKFFDGTEYVFNGFVESDPACSGAFYDRDRGWRFFNS